MCVSQPKISSSPHLPSSVLPVLCCVTFVGAFKVEHEIYIPQSRSNINVSNTIVSVLRYLSLWLCYYGFDTLPCSVCLYYPAMSDPRTFRHYSKTPCEGGLRTGNDESAAFSCCYLKHGHSELAEVATKVDAAWRRRRAERQIEGIQWTPEYTSGGNLGCAS